MSRSLLVLLVSFICSYTYSQDTTEEDPCITFQFTDIQGQIGDTVCSALQVIDFIDVLSFQFSVKYDDSVLEYLSCFDEAVISSFQCNDVNLQDDEPVLKALWFEPQGNLTSLDSAAAIMNLCFALKAEAEAGTTYLEFSDDLASEVSVGDPNDLSVANKLSFCATNDITSHVSDISENLTLTIFPNPASDNLFIENIDHNVTIEQISIYDISGQLIVTQKQPQHVVQIDLDNLRQGYYVVRIDMNDKTSYSSRLYKE